MLNEHLIQPVSCQIHKQCVLQPETIQRGLNPRNTESGHLYVRIVCTSTESPGNAQKERNSFKGQQLASVESGKAGLAPFHLGKLHSQMHCLHCLGL